MAFLNLLVLVLQLLAAFVLQVGGAGFTYNGFRSANLSLDGIAGFTSNGLLMLTNQTKQDTGHAFYPDPIDFRNSPDGEVLSFSTTFVFAIRPDVTNFSAEGLAFVISPTKVLPGGRSLGFLGIFDPKTNGSLTNHIFALEFDTFQTPIFPDLNDNHVGVDICSINSFQQKSAGYYDDEDGKFIDLTLIGGEPIQAWMDYDGARKQITVTIAPLKSATKKPRIPLLNFTYDLSPVLKQSMYVGFSSSTAPIFFTNHYVLGWSFKVDGGMAEDLDISQLPKLPRLGIKKVSYFLIAGLPLICLLSIVLVIAGVIYHIRRKRKFAEVLEDWEVAYGPHRFKYKDLYIATKGFRDTELLGAGGFGSVYRGVLPTTRRQIAVKRISHESRQGMREFVAEIVSIGRMSHRNLVSLLGYCRRKGELLLVYEYMPNGSLDRFLYGTKKSFLNWDQRFRIIKGVASGLFYLHEEWEQVVVHRDIKASNVLLDGDLNARLGDFGLAKLYDRGTDPQTTHVVGTVGYLAPEHYRTGRATTVTDVYAFGAFLLEVVCGRRPIDPQANKEDIILVDLVYSYWNDGRILEAVDKDLANDVINKDEVEMVLKLGLLCSNSDPMARPTMQKVMLYLDGSMPLPELSTLGVSVGAIGFPYGKSFQDVSTSNHSYPSSSGDLYSQFSHVTGGSFLSGGR
ncbi:OLC1v1031396C1 [Oldenlandia corymbosa var. corymbosa]|uniref:non-specific serine/threonine protein kinase n=1 Tax=Oldenlandia corymbosa var. corymbosa TaxID=529605 RepID=A0AAV1CLK1_OLDCO|nr:OLC1v1031396C1 [Oldenlandia corymbosa var. corymbosa]